jgi:hypothetical protein
MERERLSNTLLNKLTQKRRIEALVRYGLARFSGMGVGQCARAVGAAIEVGNVRSFEVAWHSSLRLLSRSIGMVGVVLWRRRHRYSPSRSLAEMMSTNGFFACHIHEEFPQMLGQGSSDLLKNLRDPFRSNRPRQTAPSHRQTILSLLHRKVVI